MPSEPAASIILGILAAEIRSLPTRHDSEAERCESAGRLLVRAIDAGAFGAPEYVSFLVLVRQRLEQESEKVSGWISAWAEARWWLAGKPEASPRLDATFAKDCERVARLVQDAANHSRTVSKRIDKATQRGPDDGQCWVSAAELEKEHGVKKAALTKWANKDKRIRRPATNADRERLKNQNVMYVYNERLVRDKLRSDPNTE